MAYEQRPNTGSVFKNEKATTPQHPGYTGSAIIGEVEYRVSIWVKNADDPNRKTFLSMKFENSDEWREKFVPKNADYKKGQGMVKGLDKKFADAVDDEIPF